MDNTLKQVPHYTLRFGSLGITVRELKRPRNLGRVKSAQGRVGSAARTVLFLMPNDPIAGVANSWQRHVDDIGEADAAERAARQLEDAVVGQRSRRASASSAMLPAASDCSNTS